MATSDTRSHAMSCVAVAGLPWRSIGVAHDASTTEMRQAAVGIPNMFTAVDLSGVGNLARRRMGHNPYVGIIFGKRNVYVFEGANGEEQWFTRQSQCALSTFTELTTLVQQTVIVKNIPAIKGKRKRKTLCPHAAPKTTLTGLQSSRG